MTDRELSSFGERLYESVLFTPLPAATVFNLALAIRSAVPWSQLPQHLKFAVFKIAASCAVDADAEQAPAPPESAERASDAARAAAPAETSAASGAPTAEAASAAVDEEAPAGDEPGAA